MIRTRPEPRTSVARDEAQESRCELRDRSPPAPGSGLGRRRKRDRPAERLRCSLAKQQPIDLHPRASERPRRPCQRVMKFSANIEDTCGLLCPSSFRS